MFAFTTLVISAAGVDSFPEATISNGQIKASLYLPDSKNGYYRGTRFDWAGVIKSLEYKGHNYFGVWFDKYDPQLHDAITGPVEEFYFKDAALGYATAKPGETFIRIGVGALRKPEEEKFDRFHTYEIVNGGEWSVKAHRDSVEFRHRLEDGPSGYRYEYHKTVRLSSGKPELVIEHTLKNTGRNTIETDVYNHNFFVIDGQQTGPDLSVTFGFDPKATRDLGGLAELQGRELKYKRELTHDEHVMTEIEGFGGTTADHSFKVENRKTGAGVHVEGDHPLSKLLFWCGWKVLSPENYVTMKIAPGKEFHWVVRYQFYTLP
jgi:hypothetical protein